MQWFDIPGYEKLYQINKFGQVKSLAKRVKSPVPWAPERQNYYPEKLLNGATDRYGYKIVRLYDGEKSKYWKVHRLVMLTFEGPSKKQVNHKNGLKNDNRLENLEYCTPKQNNIHKTQDLKQGKLNQEKVDEIRASSKTNKELAQKYGVCPSHIWAVRNFRRWK